jgi:outer membrane cobalamin receptor
MRKIIQLTAILLGYVLVCLNAAQADEVELDRIVVTPSRTEESYSDVSRKVDIITSEEIESSQANDLAQVLDKLASVNISNYGGLGATKTIRMRGSTAAQVLVLIDGRPVNSPRDGEAELSSIPLENIERIEIMHGPGSSLYGQGAMGGTVNIITKGPPKEKQKINFITSFGTFRSYIEQLSYGGKIANFGYLITGDYKSSEGFRENSEFTTRGFNTKFEYKFNPANSLILNSGFLKNKVGTPGPITAPDIDDKQVNLKNFLDLNWRFKPNENIGLSARVYQNYDRLEFLENTAGSLWDTAFKKDVHTTKTRGLDLQYRQRFCEPYQAVLGFNYVTNLNDSTTSAKHKYIVRAGYLENQLDLWKSLHINVAARIDDYSNFGSEFNPSFNFLYQFSEAVKLRGLFSRAFRAPTFNDLYWPDEGWIKGNPQLQPEKGTIAEIGLKTRLSKYLSSDLLYYRNDYHDLINWVEENLVWQPKNVDSAVMHGIEFENTIYLWDNFELDLDYNFLLAKDKKTHKYLIYQPKHKFDFSLRYNQLDNFLVELSGQFTDKRFHNPDNSLKVKRFFVLGFNFNKRLKPWLNYFLSIENLLNYKYQIIRDYPLPGFAINSGLKLDF